MDIQAKDFEINVSQEELIDIAYGLRSDLYHTIKTHWVNHQDSWEKNSSHRLNLLKRMFYALGRPDLFDEIKKEAEKIFQEFNQKRGS